MKNYVFRHGDAHYKQGKVTLEEANDLTDTGREVVAASFRDLQRRLASEGLVGRIRILTSPYGRCGDSANLGRETLGALGIDVEPVEVDEELEEVRGLSYAHFYAMVIGGRVDVGQEVVEVDRKLTNPERLSPVAYFRTDFAHKGISSKSIALLNQNHYCIVYHTERALSTTKRLNAVLDRVNSDGAQGTNILVTHEGLTGDLVNRATGDINSYLEKGMYMQVEKQGELWVASFPQNGAIKQDFYPREN